MVAGADPMIFLVAGFDEGETYGKVFQVVIPTTPTPAEENPRTLGLAGVVSRTS